GGHRQLPPACFGTRRRLGVVGDVVAGDGAAFRLTDLLASHPSSGNPPGVDVGGPAGRGLGDSHRGRAAGGRPGAGIVANLASRGPRDGSAVAVVFAERPDLEGSYGSGG